MSAPSGLAGQIGWKSESVFGTAVTVDTFPAGLLDESIKQDIARIESKGIRAGRRVQQTWAVGARTISGDINQELWNQPLATLLTHMFGTVATTGTGPYVHTATPGSLTGKSLTIQAGRPDTSGTVRAFTYAGCKIASWELACKVGDIPTLKSTVSAKSETTATALASASYDSDGAPFTFVQGSLSIAGTDVATVSDLSLKASNSLKTDRFFVGADTTSEQLETAFRDYTGTFTAEFEALTNYALYTAGTESALVLTFDNGTDSLVITMNVRFDGETPVLSGMELLSQPLPFKCIGTTDAAAITAVLTNGEATAT
jgi:hypothetical protein